MVTRHGKDRQSLRRRAAQGRRAARSFVGPALVAARFTRPKARSTRDRSSRCSDAPRRCPFHNADLRRNSCHRYRYRLGFGTRRQFASGSSSSVRRTEDQARNRRRWNTQPGRSSQCVIRTDKRSQGRSHGPPGTRTDKSEQCHCGWDRRSRWGHRCIPCRKYTHHRSTTA